MIILLIALVFILLRKSRRLGCNPEYLSRTETDSWKGFFAVIILFSHMLSYLKGLSSPFDTSFAYIILQRLPMNFLSHFGMNIYNPYLFAAISIVSTLLLAWGFTLLTNLLDRHVLKVK